MNGTSLQRKEDVENITLDNVRAVKSISEPKDIVKSQTVTEETDTTKSSVKTSKNLPWYFTDGSLLPFVSNQTRKALQIDPPFLQVIEVNWSHFPFIEGLHNS